MTATTDGNHMKPQAQCFSSMEGAEMEAVPSKKRKPFVLRIRRAEGGPKKPKGRMSAFAFFMQRCRKEHKKRSPEVPVNLTEFSKTCSEKWKTMSPKEKSEFDKMAKADKVRYDRETEAYAPPKTDRKKKKDLNAPRRPPSAFFLFCSASRPKIKSANPGISMGDVAKKLGEMWTNLSDGEKQPYSYKAAQLMAKYEKDVADYKSKGKSDGAKGPAEVSQVKVEEHEEEEEEGKKEEEEEEEKKEDEEEEEKKEEEEEEKKKEEEEEEKKEEEEEEEEEEKKKEDKEKEMKEEEEEKKKEEEETKKEEEEEEKKKEEEEEEKKEEEEEKKEEEEEEKKEEEEEEKKEEEEEKKKEKEEEKKKEEEEEETKEEEEKKEEGDKEEKKEDGKEEKKEVEEAKGEEIGEEKEEKDE